MLAVTRRFLKSSNHSFNGRLIPCWPGIPRSSHRWLRLLLAFVVITVGINFFILFDWRYLDSLPSDILGKQAFHPKPFVPIAQERESQADSEPDFWTWDTRTQFKTKGSVGWQEGIKDECDLFPTYLLSNIQAVAKTGAANHESRTDAQLSTVIKCISNVLIVSDGNHTYDRNHQAIDVLADLPPNKYIKPEDYIVYETKEREPRGHYNGSTPYYFGSPSPGRKYQSESKFEREEQEWFAYRGAGFILSTAAAHRLVDRPRNSIGLKDPRLATEYMEDIRADCFGDSILGWALHNKAGISISGLWPMFNPHTLEDIPFGKDYWCEPVISLHKTNPALYGDLWSWENERRSNSSLTVLYRDLLFSFHGNFSQRENWDAAFDAGFELPDNSTVHMSLDACRTACLKHDDCM